MRNVKATLEIFLRSLPTNCHFNIIAFESTYKSLFQRVGVTFLSVVDTVPPCQSERYSRESLQRATEFVASLDAGGGTEILSALRAVTKQYMIEGHPRQVI